MESVYQTEFRGRSHGIRSRYGSGVIRAILYSIERIISRLQDYRLSYLTVFYSDMYNHTIYHSL